MITHVASACSVVSKKCDSHHCWDVNISYYFGDGVRRKKAVEYSFGDVENALHGVSSVPWEVH